MIGKMAMALRLIVDLAKCRLPAYCPRSDLLSVQVPPRVLVQAATPLADSPTEEREDALFCSFDDSPLSQVLPYSTL